MHNEIVHPVRPEENDHQDRNKLNNQRSNLIAKTRSANMQNREIRKSNSYTGVQKTPFGKYKAKIRINKKNTYLGNYDTPEEAAATYDRAALKYYGPHAYVNFPENENDKQK